MKRPLTETDNFAYLTVALTVFLLLSALADQFLEHTVGGTVIEGAIVLTLATGVWSVRTQGHLFKIGLGLTAGVLLISVADFMLDWTGIAVAHSLILLGFFALTIWVAVRQVMFSGRVDGNAILGAISIYLLLGMIWAMLYRLVEVFLPGSFHGLAAAGQNADLSELIYFSFVSLTTMGFGDITPAFALARYLAFMEGLVGQFYIAVLVASLVGVRISNWQQE